MKGLTVKKHVVIVVSLFLLIAADGAIAENRTIDGTNNNLTYPDSGSAGILLRRVSPSEYSDEISVPAGAYRPSPRLISNQLMYQKAPMPDSQGRSDYLWAWGQFIDHDISLTVAADPTEYFNIVIMPGDPVFDPNGTGGATLPFNRAMYDYSTGTSPENPREQVNAITSWLDASMVYGSDQQRANWLRTGSGGRLKVTTHPTGDLLPYNDGTNPNAGGPGTDLFVAGDVRANEHVVLTCLHTLFAREHNRMATDIAAANTGWSDEQIYQKARKMVNAEIQVITYKEFLPALLGEGAMSEYTGYNSDVNSAITNIFSTAAYRFGHSAVSPRILRLDNDHREIPDGHLDLDEGFFDPTKITDEGGVEPVLRGLVYQVHQEIDVYIIDAFRDNLFAQFDLTSLNMQRGRDHGLPNYNQVREDFGFGPVASFAEINSDPVVQSAMEGLYGSVDNIDPWVGMLAEHHKNGSMVGLLRHKVIKEQFEALRDGDRFWYVIDPGLSPEDLDFLEAVRLKDVIEMNTEITGLPENVFYVP